MKQTALLRPIVLMMAVFMIFAGARGMFPADAQAAILTDETSPLFEYNGLLETLYRGLVLSDVPEDTVVEGFSVEGVDLLDEGFAFLFREADSFFVIFVTDGVFDSQSFISSITFGFIDLGGAKNYLLSQSYYFEGESYFYRFEVDDREEGNTLFDCDISEEDIKQGLAAMDILASTENTMEKLEKMKGFYYEMQVKYPDGIIDPVEYNQPDASTSEQFEGVSENNTEGKSYLFNKEYLQMLYDRFIASGTYDESFYEKMEQGEWEEVNDIDGYLLAMDYRNLYGKQYSVSLNNMLEGTALIFYTDKGAKDRTSEITGAVLYTSTRPLTVDSAVGCYGFSKQYGKNGEEQYFIFRAPSMGPKDVIGIAISEDDFKLGVDCFSLGLSKAYLQSVFTSYDNTKNKALQEREERFEYFFDEMQKKYASLLHLSFSPKIADTKHEFTSDEITLVGEYAGNSYFARPKKNEFFLWFTTSSNLYFTEKKIGKYDAVNRFMDSLYFVSSKNILLLDLSKVEEKKLPKSWAFQKGSTVVNGETYLGWLGSKGELFYTADGVMVNKAELPKGAEIAFRKDVMAAKLQNFKKPDELAQFWLVQPKDGVLSISQEEYEKVVALPEFSPIP